MSHRHAHLTPGHVAPAHRRAARPLDLFTPPAEARTAAAVDDVEQAEQLIADLLALVEGKLIEPIADPGGSTRYAPRGHELYPAALANPPMTDQVFNVVDPFNGTGTTLVEAAAPAAISVNEYAARIEPAVSRVGGALLTGQVQKVNPWNGMLFSSVTDVDATLSCTVFRSDVRRGRRTVTGDGRRDLFGECAGFRTIDFSQSGHRRTVTPNR